MKIVVLSFLLNAVHNAAEQDCAVAVGENEAERAVNDKVVIDLLIFAGAGRACAGDIANRRTLDSASVHLEIGLMNHALADESLIGYIRHIAFINVEEIHDAEVLHKRICYIAVKGCLILGEEDSRMMQKLVFLVNISVITEIVDVENVVKGDTTMTKEEKKKEAAKQIFKAAKGLFK